MYVICCVIGLKQTDVVKMCGTLCVGSQQVRVVASDTQWLSPAFQRDSVTFHFTWSANEKAVRYTSPPAYLLHERTCKLCVLVFTFLDSELFFISCQRVLVGTFFLSCYFMMCLDAWHIYFPPHFECETSA